jgi:shikimate kinase
MAEMLKEPLLLLLTGPVGGGKSTTALALAHHLRKSGRSVAVIDLDQVYCMVRQLDGFNELTGWDAARRGAAALADSFFASGLDVVVVEGEFFTPDEYRQLRDHLDSKPADICFTLMVSYEQVLHRVQGDPTRGASRDPEFLKRLHDNFVSATPYLETVSVLVQADHPSSEDVAALIADAVLARAHSA